MRHAGIARRFATKRLLAALLLWDAFGVAEATTTLGRGIVLEVGKAKDAKGNPTDVDRLLVRLTWGNYGGEGSVVGIEVPADSVILLDGKLAERAEAMKPGRLVKALLDCNYFEFYTKTGQLLEERPPADPADACYALTLDRAVPVMPLMAAVKMGSPAAVGSLQLLLDCRRDRIAGAAGVLKGAGSRVKGFAGNETLHRGVFHDVDATGLAVRDGRVTGAVTVRFFGGNKAKVRAGETQPELPADGGFASATYTVDAAIGANGAVTGTYRGTVEKTEVSGKVAGAAFSRPAAPAAYTVWFFPYSTPGSTAGDVLLANATSAVGFKVQDGQVKPDYVSGSHSSRIGQVEGGTAAVEGGALRADLKLLIGKAEGGTRLAVRVEGRVIGDMLFGTYAATDDAGKPCGAGRLRGEVLAFDCPSTEGWNEIAFRKEVARLKAERDAKKTQP
jgi:hypothetical protein